MRWRDLFTDRANWVFAAAQAAAGLLNYLFQVVGSRQLSLVDFGLFSVWLAEFSVILFVALWVQTLTTIRRGLPGKMNSAAIWGGGVLLVALSAIAIQSGHPLGMDLCGWAWAVGNGALCGVLLSQRRMILVAGGTILGVLGKFALIYFVPDIEGFAAAIRLSPAISFFVFALLWPSKKKPQKTVALKGGWSLILSSLFLSLVTAAVPQLDLLAAQRLLAPEELGTFAKVALIYKGFFFLFLIGAQILMTYQVSGAGLEARAKQLLGANLVGSLVFAGLGFGIPLFGAPASWVAGSLAHIVSLTVLFLVVQQEATRREWKWPAAFATLFGVHLLVAHNFKPSLESYFPMAWAAEFFLLGVYFWFSASRRPVKSRA